MFNHNKPIYFDYNATTPVDPLVIEAMLPYFFEHPGNAASRSHAFGWVAEEAVDQARQQIAGLINVLPEELTFTSGATEGDNLGIKGVFERYHKKGNHIITVKTEHNAVLDTCLKIEKQGGRVTYLDVDKNGLIDLDELHSVVTDETILVSIMWANNETGVIQPMKEIGAICEEKNVLLMSDATQAVGKIAVDPKAIGVHIMAFTAHKMYGPKGVGAVYVSNRNPRVKLTAQIDGGGHENGNRSGTLNVPGIVGFGKAAALAQEQMQEEALRLGKFRDQLEKELSQHIEATFLNGKLAPRMPNVSNIGFRYVDAEQLMIRLREEVAASSGSACSSASLEPSHVLLAMGLSEERASGSIRLSMGRFTKQSDVDFVIKQIIEGVEKVRMESPVWSMFKQGLIQ